MLDFLLRLLYELHQSWALTLMLPHLCGNRDLDLDTSFDVDDNLLDDLGGSVETVRGLLVF